MSYGGPQLSDLELRYPFAPRSRQFFDSVTLEERLASPDVLEQAEKRLMNALGRVRYDPSMQKSVEFSSFFAAALVASQDPVLTSRFSKKEGERARDYFRAEEPKAKVEALSECFGAAMGWETVDGRARFSIPFEGYLALASKYELARLPKWKLARQGLDRGVVRMSDNLVNDLFGDCAQAAIGEGVRNLRKGAFPKQLQGARIRVIQYVPTPKPRTGKGYEYVEELLKHPVSDGRHRMIWLVLAPYCLPSDAIIPGDFIPISKLSEGGWVLGRNGQHQRVLKAFERQYNGKLVVVKGSGILPLRITPEHPILTLSTYPEALRKFRDTGRLEAIQRKMSWKRADCLTPRLSYRKGDYLVIPRFPGTFGDGKVSLDRFVQQLKRPWLTKIKELPLDFETSWLLGVYVAEGSNTPHNRTRDIVFTLSSDEKEMATRLVATLGALGLASHTDIVGKRLRVVASSSALGLALDSWCGRGAENKRMPEFVIYHRDSRLLQSFLDGYMQGDGARQLHPHRIANTRSQIEGATTSHVLAIQLQLAYARLGKCLSLYVKKGHRTVILGVSAIQKDQYIFVLRDNATRSRSIATDHSILIPVTSVESETFEGTVYNVETPDGAYLAGNVVVHNCVNIKKMSDEDAIEKIRDFVSAAGETRDLRRFVEYNVRRARRNGLLPPTFSTLKMEHPDVFSLLPKEVITPPATKEKGSEKKP